MTERCYCGGLLHPIYEWFRCEWCGQEGSTVEFIELRRISEGRVRNE